MEHGQWLVVNGGWQENRPVKNYGAILSSTMDQGCL
jgi:hypothetical protein